MGYRRLGGSGLLVSAIGLGTNREGIAVYAKYGAQASGAIEKTMDVTVGRRLKAKGTSNVRLTRR